MNKSVKSVRHLKILKKSPMDKEAESLEECVMNEFRSNRTDISLIVIGRDNANRVVIVKYDFMKDKWGEIKDTSASMEEKPGIGYYDNKVFFIGGEDFRGNKLNRAFYFDMDTDTVEKLPDMFFPRSSPAVFGNDNAILVVGGLGRFSRQGLSIVEQLSLTFPKWTTCQSMKKRRSEGTQALNLEGFALVTGGGCERCELFNSKLKAWTLMKAVPAEVLPETAIYAIADDKLYVFKYFKPDVVYKLDLKTDNWSPITCKGKPPEWATCAVGWKSIIFVLDKSKCVYMLDIVTNYWSVITKLPRQIIHPVYIAV